MNALPIHSGIRRLRRSAAVVVVTCVLGGMVAVEHCGLPDVHGSEMAAFCVAVLPVVALLTRHAIPDRRLLWSRLGPVTKPPQVLTPTTEAPLARAGPSTALVLRL